MSAHTPGPWIVSHDPDGSPDDYCIGVPDGKIDQVAVCSKRDAPIISAAPDMYEALKVARIFIRDCGEDWERVLAVINDALAKAGGQ